MLGYAVFVDYLYKLCLVVALLRTSLGQTFDRHSFDASKVHSVTQLSDVWQRNFREFNCSLQTRFEWRPIGEDVSFWCFYRKSGRFRYTLNDVEHLGKILQHNRSTVLFIHGWLQDRTQFAKEVKQLSLTMTDRNYCLVDFEPLAHIEMGLFRELLSPRIATLVARFILSLSAIGIPPREVSLVGEGVTAHLAGHVGAILGGRLGTIIGLDPLGSFYSSGPERQNKQLTLDPSDARWVQVWYTSIGQLDSSVRLGHQNIYVNGGLHPQPYCACFASTLGTTNFLTELCSHYFVVKVFKATFDPSIALIATRCRSYKDFLAGNCVSRRTTRVRGDGTDAGNFFLETSCKPPFLLHPNTTRDR